MGEFELIKHYFQRPELQGNCPVALGPGDDCALITPPANHQLAVSADTFVANVHFFSHSAPQDIASRCLAASLSDLAAMGATPVGYMLCLTMPALNHSFLQSFSDGLAIMSQDYSVALIGGDITKGPLTISIQVLGWTPMHQALRRDGAKIGDDIYVSGYLGDAGGGLRQLKDSTNPQSYLVERFHRPVPRIKLGQWLLKKATAAIDISDGLLQDLGHILQQSSVGALLELSHIPLSSVLQHNFHEQDCLSMALTAGEDFELCFTLPPNLHQDLMLFAKTIALPITKIGVIEPEEGIRALQYGIATNLPTKQGWQHF